MSKTPLPDDLQYRLFQCFLRCNEALEKYDQYIKDLKTRDQQEASCAGAGLWIEHLIDADKRDFDCCISPCWHEANNLLMVDDPPAPPNPDDSIEHKAHCVRQLRTWARGYLTPNISAVDVAERVIKLLDAMAASRPFDGPTMSIVDEALNSVRRAAIAAEIRYSNIDSTSEEHYQLLRELEHLARVSVPPTRRSVHGDYYHKAVYQRFCDFVAGLDEELASRDDREKLTVSPGPDANDSDALREFSRTILKGHQQEFLVALINQGGTIPFERFPAIFNDKQIDPVSRHKSMKREIDRKFRKHGLRYQLFQHNNATVLSPIGCKKGV